MAYVTRRQRAEKRKKKMKRIAIIITVMAILCIAWIVALKVFKNKNNKAESDINTVTVNSEGIPAYNGKPYVEVNGNKPYFTEEDKKRPSFEAYSELDELGRCGVAYACVSRELMPTEERGEIGKVKPTGWVQNKYEGIVDSKPPYLYNRCHLIAYCLTGENANEKNLITGTRYMNVQGMLPFEEKVARYLDSHEVHVLYRVTPDFKDSNLLASGVLIEAYSIEDNGEGICFCVYCYNVQPGVEIDYKTGENKVE